MKTKCSILLIMLLCAAPLWATAAETAPADGPKGQPAPLAAAQPVRIGYVDINRIAGESALGKSSQAQAKERQGKFQARIETKRKQLDKQKAALEAKFATLTPPQREAKAKEFQKKVEEFQKFVMDAEKELQNIQEGLSKALFEAIEQAAAEYGKANGLALVVVKRELLYLASGVDSRDVTEGILALLNEKVKK
ncbi:MAG: OmpH family outer membrane protein [Deltaproteobacteria bacterium]|nr:OmpH family outer membrane protein [Deltaproteobacteria bacterium]